MAISRSFCVLFSYVAHPISGLAKNIFISPASDIIIKIYLSGIKICFSGACIMAMKNTVPILLTQIKNKEWKKAIYYISFNIFFISFLILIDSIAAISDSKKLKGFILLIIFVLMALSSCLICSKTQGSFNEINDNIQ